MKQNIEIPIIVIGCVNNTQITTMNGDSELGVNTYSRLEELGQDFVGIFFSKCTKKWYLFLWTYFNDYDIEFFLFESHIHIEW